jgi:outer membrane protein assembly factor BamB
VGNLVFYGGSDGIVRVLDANTGKSVWTAYTGGSIRFPPTIWHDRAFVASGDGWVYSFEAATGRLLWRFRAAPVERWIPVYGQLLSTWPAASGVLVEDGVAYVAAGIVNFDGTHVYALDAITGALKWQNNSSGHLDPAGFAGVSVQGHMIIHDGKLWLAGGNVVSPAMYQLSDGKCLNEVSWVHRTANNNVPSSEGPRGSELYLVANRVMVSDQPLYAHPKWKVYDASVLNKTWVSSMDDRDLLWVNNSKLLCYPKVGERRAERLLASWGKPQLPDLKSLWEVDCRESVAVALCRNAVVLAKGCDLVAYGLEDGRWLWQQMMPGVAVPWGLAVDRSGRVIVALENGQVACFGEAKLRLN